MSTHVRVNAARRDDLNAVFKNAAAALTGAWTTQHAVEPTEDNEKEEEGQGPFGVDLVRGPNRGANRRRHCDRRAGRDGASQIYVDETHGRRRPELEARPSWLSRRPPAAPGRLPSTSSSSRRRCSACGTPTRELWPADRRVHSRSSRARPPRPRTSITERFLSR